MYNETENRNKEFTSNGGEYYNPFFSFFNDYLEDTTRKVLRTDISEDDNSYLLEIEVPGIDKKDISMQLENQYLVVKATLNKDSAKNYIKNERRAETYIRKFFVGDNVQKSDIEANVKDGMLYVKINKAEERKAAERNIDIL